MLSSKLLCSFVKSITQQQQLAQNTAVALVNANFFHTDSTKFSVRHGGAGRLYYNIMKERPLGPNKKLAPNVKYDDKKQKSQSTKQGSRMGTVENYRYIVHYPEVRNYLSMAHYITQRWILPIIRVNRLLQCTKIK